MQRTETKVRTGQALSVSHQVIISLMMAAVFVIGFAFAAVSAKSLESSNVAAVNFEPSGKIPIYWEPDGNDPYVFGHTFDLSEVWSVVNYDYCTYSPSTLVEYTIGGSRSINCPYGCYNGRCTYEYETCPDRWECYNTYARAHINPDCTWSEMESRNSDQWRCQNGEFVAIPHRPTPKDQREFQPEVTP